MIAQKDKVRSAFAAADRYETEAHVQRAVALDLARRIGGLPLPPDPAILEVGCGTGFLTEALLPMIAGGQWRITDIAPEMVARARAKLGKDARLCFCVQDGEASVADVSRYDLICSSLALQWFQDLPGGLARLANRLKPGGHLIVTTLAAGSFAEWEAAHRAVGLVAATPAYPTRHELEGYCSVECRASVEVSTHIQHHLTGRAFLKALKAIGAHVPREARPPLSAPGLRRVLAEYDAGPRQISYQVATIILTRES